MWTRTRTIRLCLFCLPASSFAWILEMCIYKNIIQLTPKCNNDKIGKVDLVWATELFIRLKTPNILYYLDIYLLRVLAWLFLWRLCVIMILPLILLISPWTITRTEERQVCAFASLPQEGQNYFCCMLKISLDEVRTCDWDCSIKLTALCPKECIKWSC